jgi:Response regulator containing a CheY-like receiver domain and an HTH DNA-binding domain
MTVIRIAVIDPHPLFREGVTRSLGDWPEFEVVAAGGSGEEAIAIAEEVRPDVMLMDISMPQSSAVIVPSVLARLPGTKIIMMAAAEANEEIADALRHGAKGYVLKAISSEELVEVLRTVAAGEHHIPAELPAISLAPASAGEQVRRSPLERLTPREFEVLSLVASGLSNKRIAIALDLHEKTVKHHMTRIFAKLKVTNRTEAALAAREAMATPSAPAEEPGTSAV